MVVGGLHAGHAGEGPQRRPALEQVLGEGAVAPVAGSCAMPAQAAPFQLLLEGSDALGKASAIAVLSVEVPGGEEASGDLHAGLPELLLGTEALAVGGKVARQVSPAELPSLRLEVVVGPPAIRAGDAGKLLAQQCLDLALVTIGCDAKDRRAGGERAPEGTLAAAGAPAGLIDVKHRGAASLVEQLLVGAP